MIRSVIYVKGICFIRMSSFIVTPYRMRKPSTQVSRSIRSSVQPPVVPDMPEVVRVDAMTELQNTVLSLKQECEDIKSSTISGIENLRSEMTTDVGLSKHVQQIDTQNKQLRRKLDTLKSEMAPERGVSKRVSSLEAKLSFVTNKFEAYKDEHEHSHTSLNDKLLTIDDRIACHPSLKILSSRMDTIEASIDRLMSTLSGLSQTPVIQKRVAGSRSSDDGNELIRFGTIHRITPH